MAGQIFKKTIPDSLLFSLLEKMCLKTDKYYQLDMNAYRKMLFHNYHIDFFDTIREFYFLGKQFYIDRQITYRSFTNVIRQICKHNSLIYTSQMKYNESKYNIDFFIYY